MQKLNVYIIEDNDADYTLINYHLKKSNDTEFKISRGYNLNEAKEYLSENRIEVDIVLLDLSLPDSNYDNTLKEIRTLTSTIPVIVLTSIDMSKGYEAVKLGAQDFINKDDITVHNIEYKLLFAIERYGYLKQLEFIAFIDPLSGMYTLNFLDYMIQQNHAMAVVDCKFILIEYFTEVDYEAVKRSFDDDVKQAIKLMSTKFTGHLASDESYQYVMIGSLSIDKVKVFLKQVEDLFKTLMNKYDIRTLKLAYSYQEIDDNDDIAYYLSRGQLSLKHLLITI